MNANEEQTGYSSWADTNQTVNFSTVGGILYCEHFEFGVTDTARHFGATQSDAAQRQPIIWAGDQKPKPPWSEYKHGFIVQHTQSGQLLFSEEVFAEFDKVY